MGAAAANLRVSGCGTHSLLRLGASSAAGAQQLEPGGGYCK